MPLQSCSIIEPDCEGPLCIFLPNDFDVLCISNFDEYICIAEFFFTDKGKNKSEDAFVVIMMFMFSNFRFKSATPIKSLILIWELEFNFFNVIALYALVFVFTLTL